MSRLVREYVPLDQGRRRLAATAVSPPLITNPEDGFLVFANSAGHRLLVFALLINFDENKLGEKKSVFRIPLLFVRIRIWIRTNRSTKYIYIYIERVPQCSVPSSELRLFHHLCRQRMLPSLRNQRRGGGVTHSPAGEGLEESQFRRLEKKLSTLLTL
jgi:hypothetical protein